MQRNLRNTEPELLMLKVEMNRRTSSICSLESQLMLQEGQDDLEPVSVLLCNNKKQTACLFPKLKRKTEWRAYSFLTTEEQYQ